MIIGIIAKQHQRAAVQEFFELFKVPWEYCRPEKTYDVLISTDASAAKASARVASKLTIFSSPEPFADETPECIRVLPETGPVLLQYEKIEIPVYRKTASVNKDKKTFIEITGRDEAAGHPTARKKPCEIRLGYDIFDEIEHLLQEGQTPTYAHLPAIDIHIALLREWILAAGIWLVEIPPCPADYDYIVCLTHDVDFIGIREHGFDRSLIGFISRVVFPGQYLRNTRGRISLARLVKNWRALVSLPAVHLGLCRDFWFDIDRYLEIEKGLGATYFIIPFKNTPGESPAGSVPAFRAAKYDALVHRDTIQQLLGQGCEVGVHGIDAWHDTDKGKREQEAISGITGKKTEGVRMHWLYFSRQAPGKLEDAGFSYDTTLGFNETMGFRSGTTQAFQLPGTLMMEIPLNVMDTALFTKNRMGLNESQALAACAKMTGVFRKNGGVFTVNWHTRSLNPERNWDEFYIELLEVLKKDKAWFTTCHSAAQWFRTRRSFRFKHVSVSGDKIKVVLDSSEDAKSDTLRVRFHLPGNQTAAGKRGRFQDVRLSGMHEAEFTYSGGLADGQEKS